MQSTFDSTKESLSVMLADAATGKLQLPDFQRGWVWDDYGIRSLLASVSQAFPIRAVMMLQTGGEVQFRPRAHESDHRGHAPSEYLTRLEDEAGISEWQMDNLLKSHAIEPNHLRNDDYVAFMAKRKEALLTLAEKAMGKRIPRDQAPLEGEDIGEDVEEVLEGMGND